MRRDSATTPGMSAWMMAQGMSTSTPALRNIAAITAAASLRDSRCDESESTSTNSARSFTWRWETTGSWPARRRQAVLDAGAVPSACHSVRSCLIVGESVAATMKGRVHQTPHQNPHDSKKLEKSLPPDKRPGQRLNESEDGQSTWSDLHRRVSPREHPFDTRQSALHLGEW